MRQLLVGKKAARVVPTQLNGYYLTAGLLALCTVAGILVAARFRREVEVDLAPPTTEDLLGPLEKAYYSGLMRPDEIERIRASVQKPASPEQPAGAKPAARRTQPTSDPVLDSDLDGAPPQPPVAG